MGSWVSYFLPLQHFEIISDQWVIYYGKMFIFDYSTDFVKWYCSMWINQLYQVIKFLDNKLSPKIQSSCIAWFIKLYFIHEILKYEKKNNVHTMLQFGHILILILLAKCVKFSHILRTICTVILYVNLYIFVIFHCLP